MSPKFITRLFFCLLSFAFILSACSSGASAAQPGQPPQDVVEEFYSWYLGDPSAPPKDPRQSPLLSPDLLRRLEEMYTSPVPTDIISFVCAQDIPQILEVTPVETGTETAQVDAKTSFGGTVNFHLKVIDGKWLIDSLSCK
jgi:hypothetical protein